MFKNAFVLLIAVIMSYSGFSQQSILHKQINVEVNNQTAEEILDILSIKTSFYFTYDPSILPQNKTFTFSYENTELHSVLDRIFPKKTAEYKILKDHIIICPKKDENFPFIELPDSSLKSIVLKGQIVDSKTKDPIPFVSVGILNTTFGMVSNELGKFRLNVPVELTDSIVFTAHIGYKTYQTKLKDFLEKDMLIELDENMISVQEVIIRYNDPLQLIRNAIKNRDINYPQEAKILHAFYREAVLKGQNLLTISEAVIKIRKSPYKTSIINDKIKLDKSRKIVNSELIDTVFLKLKDGLYSSVNLDIMKNQFEFFDPLKFEYYKYNTVDIVTYNDKTAYVIEFKPKDHDGTAFYKGRMYIDTRTYAMIGADFEVDFKMQNKVTNFVVKKSRQFSVKPISAKYIVSYKEYNGEYYLNHVRADLEFKVRKKEDLFASKYKTFFETAVFQFENDTDNESFERKDIVKKNLVLIDNNFSYDADFWGDKNFIPPEQSFEEALKQIKVKLEYQ